ncbi:MAG: hypothetical protein DWQ10_05985, partial [Calditrichaeota bacterium]
MLQYVVSTVFMCSLLFQTQASNTQPCQSAEARQFDFWLGKWDLSWPGGQGGTPKDQIGTGTNEITKILGSCVVRENFSSQQITFSGQSYSV